MFGAIRPTFSCSEAEQRSNYRKLYCTNCKALGASLGFSRRLFVTHEIVLLTAVLDGLAPTAAEPASCVCPLVPWQSRTIVNHDSSQVQAAIAAQALLARAWIDDKIHDGSFWARPLNLLQSADAKWAYQTLKKLGVTPPDFETLGARQLTVEHQSPTIAQVSAPSSNLLGDMFRQFAKGDVVEVPQGFEFAFIWLGRGLGKITYLLDALRDVHADRRSGDFNPCLPDGVWNQNEFESVRNLLSTSLDEVEALAHQIPWRRNVSLIHSLLGDQLKRSAFGALAIATQEQDEQDEDEQKRDEPGPPSLGNKLIIDQRIRDLSDEKTDCCTKEYDCWIENMCCNCECCCDGGCGY